MEKTGKWKGRIKGLEGYGLTSPFLGVRGRLNGLGSLRGRREPL